MPAQFSESLHEFGLPKKMSPPPSQFKKTSKKVAEANSEYFVADPVCNLSINCDEPFAPPMPNACGDIPAEPMLSEDCDGDCEAEAPAVAAAPWGMGCSYGAAPSLKGLFVFHVHVGQAAPEKAIELMNMVQKRYQLTENRLKENGYEVMWLPTRSDSRSEFFPTH